MDVAYPVGVKRENPDQLIWSIRSVVAHFPVDRIFIAGHLPDWVSDEVIHLPTTQDATKFINIGRNLEAVLASGISDRFLWMNDDFFFLEDFDEDIPLFAREGPYDYFCANLKRNLSGSGRGPRRREAPGPNLSRYIAGMIAQKDIIKKWGVDVHEPINTDGHMPIPIDKQRCIEVIERVKAEYPSHEIGHFRALYGNADPQLPSTPIRDPKVQFANRMWKEGRPFVSTSIRSWKSNIGDRLREMYGEPTRFEATT